MKNVLIPNWSAPANVKAFTTLKSSGISLLPKTDDPIKIAHNRAHLKTLLNLPNDPIWIKQVHGNQVCLATPTNRGQSVDATFTNESNQVCVVLTADCLPILLSDRKGKKVAAIHAGWRGLVSGVIASTINAMKIPGQDLVAWIGPGISAKNYEVGAEVKSAFLTANPTYAEAFTPSPTKRWFLDLIRIAEMQLIKQSVSEVSTSGFCTYDEAELFHSYRRESQLTGHIATLIYIAN